MAITTDQVKALRDQTGVSIMQCKQALEEAGGDMGKALVLLKKRSGTIAGKKVDRELKAGTIAPYIHGGTVGTMVELLCESDFVAKNEEFKKLAYDIAMQVAATNPSYLSFADVPDTMKAEAEAVFAKELDGKPPELTTQIMEGKLRAYFLDKTLLDQPFIKDETRTIRNCIEGAIQKFGEKIAVGRFVRFSIHGH